MNKFTAISARIPEEVYKEFILRVPEGERSKFIREAIYEKLQKTPRPDKIAEIEERLIRVEEALSYIKKYLAELEVLTYHRGKVNLYSFCIDTLDREIIDYLLNNRGATTTEIAETLNTNRWLILNRLRRIQKLSKRQLGKPILNYIAGERYGKRKAWWIKEEFIEH